MGEAKSPGTPADQLRLRVKAVAELKAMPPVSCKHGRTIEEQKRELRRKGMLK